MLEKKDKDFLIDMWDLDERDIYTDNRNTTIIAPNNEEDIVEMVVFLKEKYKVKLYKRNGSKFFREHTLVRVIRK